MKYKYQTQFERLPFGLIFEKNGTIFRKKSSRTAEIIRPTEYAGTWFYFSANELANIEKKDIVSLTA